MIGAHTGQELPGTGRRSLKGYLARNPQSAHLEQSKREMACLRQL